MMVSKDVTSNSGSNNSNLMAACNSSDSAAEYNNNPADFIRSSSKNYSSSNKDGISMILNMNRRRMIIPI